MTGKDGFFPGLCMGHKAIKSQPTTATENTKHFGYRTQCLLQSFDADPTSHSTKARLNLLVTVICRSKARMGKVDLETPFTKMDIFSASLGGFEGIFNLEVSTWTYKFASQPFWSL